MSKVNRRNEDLLRMIDLRCELYYPYENAQRAEEAINTAIKYIKKCQAQAETITRLQKARERDNAREKEE